MEIKGQIVDIRYHNDINDYTVCEFKIDDETIISVGYLPFVNLGDSLKLQGNYVVHQEYGKQFKIDSFEKIMPETLDALERYLSSGNIKGIGEATAKKIIEQFGEETISILRYTPEKLSQIKGISRIKAISMGEEFNEKWELWQIVGFLERFGISAANSRKVFDKLGKNAIEEIEKNPYVLIDITYGVDFKKIDKMAIDMGMEYNNERRIISGIKYSIVLATYNGHTCVLKENLIQFVEQLLAVTKEEIENIIINCNVKQEIYVEKIEEKEYVYLPTFYKAENTIAEKLINLINTKNIKKIKHFNLELEKVEQKSEIILSEEQKEAIKAVNDNNVCVITGGPGTGKTTIIKTIIEVYKNNKMKPILCAPTGRAAKRMTEATGEEAKTIHRLLEIGKLQEENNIESVDYDIAPIDADIVIIDEASMIDVFIMNHILKGLYLGTKLVLVGDKDQLPSVGAGSVLEDIINSEKACIVKLNKIFRQAAKSNIIINAHNVNNGESFSNNCNSKESDFFYVEESNQDKILNNVITLCKERVKEYNDMDFYKDIQILTPTKKGILGTRELNKQLQRTLNPPHETKIEKKYGEIIFRKGDRIMQVKNNYEMLWNKIKNNENGSGVFNGELGTIKNINEYEKTIEVIFDDDKIATYTYSDLDQLEHSYAITIHKAQGSEFQIVIIVVPQSSPMLLTRNLLYTGITRAKRMLVVIGNKNIIDFMIKNENNKKRITGLQYKLFIKK